MTLTGPVPVARLKRLNEEFQVVKVLGNGSFGVVVMAKNYVDKVKYAVKCVDITQEDKATILKEVQYLAKMTHPNIVAYKTAWMEEVNGSLFLIIQMERCKYSMVTHIEKGFLHANPEEAWTMLRETLEGLKFIHDKGYMHRDIKTENLLIDFTRHVKVADFGVVKASRLQSHINTALHTICGTEQFMAPEVWSSKYTNAVDVFSSGVVAFEMFNPPPASENERLSALNKFRITQSLPKDFASHLPEGQRVVIRGLIQRMTSTNPKDRPSFIQLLNDKTIPFNFKENDCLKIDKRLTTRLQTIRQIPSQIPPQVPPHRPRPENEAPPVPDRGTSKEDPLLKHQFALIEYIGNKIVDASRLDIDDRNTTINAFWFVCEEQYRRMQILGSSEKDSDVALELRANCHRAISILNSLINSPNISARFKVGFWGFQGDHFKWMADTFDIGDAIREGLALKALAAYKSGLEFATNEKRLTLAHKLAALYHFTLNDDHSAGRILRDALAVIPQGSHVKMVAVLRNCLELWGL